jgi:hypothetical protein
VSGVCAAPAELDPNHQLPQSGSGSNTDGGTVNPVPDALPFAQPDSGAGPGVSGTCALGPDGWCWSIYSNPSTTAAWVAPPSAAGEHAYLTAEPGNVGTAGVGFSFAADNPPIDLTRFDRIFFTATASTNFMFSVGSNLTVGCATNFSGNGTRTTYTYEFSKCTLWSRDTIEPPFTYARVDRFYWQTIWGVASSLDIEIVPDILFCLGTQCTTNPLSP